MLDDSRSSLFDLNSVQYLNLVLNTEANLDRKLLVHLVAVLNSVLKVKKTISGTMELHLPPIIVISVAAAAAILEDVHDEAPPPSR